MLGTAGAGKTRATAALLEYMATLGLNAISVNLDAGVRKLPYNPNVDVRDFVDIDELVANYGLGPNGAMVASMDLTATKAEEIREEIDYVRPDYVVVDTPGQVELFAYRSSGLLTAKALSEGESNASIFMIDPALGHSAESFASIMLLGISVMYRVQMPQSFALSKVDLVEKSYADRVVSWSEDPQTLIDDLSAERLGLRAELGFEVAKLLQSAGLSVPLLPFSSVTAQGIGGLFGELQNIWGTTDDSYDLS